MIFFLEKESHIATDIHSKSWKNLTDENTIVFQSTTHIRSDQTKLASKETHLI